MSHFHVSSTHLTFCDRFGQPPHDLVQQMAPGLEFDDGGMPKMDGADSGLPFPIENEDCNIM